MLQLSITFFNQSFGRVVAALFCILLLTPLAPLTAQVSRQVGGEASLLLQLDGASDFRYLGQAVANAGDVNADGHTDMIIGSTGSATVLSGADGSVLHQLQGTSGADHFGTSVGSAGDINLDGFADLIVGAPESSASMLMEAGSAYIFSGFDGAVLRRIDGSRAGEHLGSSVVGIEDLNSDGYPEVLVGAPDFAMLPIYAVGRTRVYSGADWSVIYEFTGTAQGDRVGGRLATAGDVDADGVADFLIGDSKSFGFYLGGFSAYSGATGTLLHRRDSGSNINRLGAALAGVGDLDHDGYDDFLVGAPFSNPGGTIATGRAVLYSGQTGQVLNVMEPPEGARSFGDSVAGTGDIDGDGTPEFMIGTGRFGFGYYDDIGIVVIYSGADFKPLFQIVGDRDNMLFGTAIASLGELDGDEGPEILVGAEQSGAGGFTFSGSAFVVSPRPYLRASSRTISASAGGSVDLEIDFPSVAAGYAYHVLLSAHGTGPTRMGALVPLSVDPLLRMSAQGIYPARLSHVGMSGSLDANGDAVAQFSLPAGLPASQVGRGFWFAAVSHSLGYRVEFSSIAAATTISP